MNTLKERKKRENTLREREGSFISLSKLLKVRYLFLQILNLFIETKKTILLHGLILFIHG